MTATLKRALGEAGAFIDDSSGRPSRLVEALAALAEGSANLRGQQAVPATAVLDAMVAQLATKLQGLTLLMGTTGTATGAILELHVDGSAVASVTIDNTEDDGTVKSATLTAPIDVPAGSLVELVVAAIPTAGADLAATARLSPLVVE